MARRFTIELLMNLATRIGANPTKLAGTRTNISFLGKGPSQNPLFQNRLAGLENASPQNLGDPKKLFGAIEDAVVWAKDGKLNGIQTEILGHNLTGIERILHPPPLPALPMASVTPIRSGIAGIPRGVSPGEALYASRTGGIKSRNPIVDDRGRTWDFQSRLPEPGPKDLARLNKALDAKTGMSRAIARQILQQDTRLQLPEEIMISLRTGSRGPDPLELMKKYYGRSMENFDTFLNDVIPRPGMNPRDIATRVLSEVELIPAFAHGGLARILEV